MMVIHNPLIRPCFQIGGVALGAGVTLKFPWVFDFLRSYQVIFVEVFWEIGM